MTLAGQQAGQDVKLLHYTGSTWEDVTTFPPANGHLVTGSLSTYFGTSCCSCQIRITAYIDTLKMLLIKKNTLLTEKDLQT